MTNKYFEKLLGLTSNERKIYRFLSDTPLPISDIQHHTTLPRMTAHYALERLWRRKLVNRIKRNKRFLYYKTSEEELFRNMLPQDSSFEHRVLSLTDDSNLLLHKGWDAIYAMYEKICRENAESRIYTIQTTASTEWIYNHYSLEQLDSLHNIMKEHHIVVDDIIEEDFFEPIHRKYKDSFSNIVQSFLDRLTVTYVLPIGYISFTNDMVVSNNAVVFIDWSKQIAIEVRTDQIVQMCMNFYDILQHQAKKMQFRELAKIYTT